MNNMINMDIIHIMNFMNIINFHKTRQGQAPLITDAPLTSCTALSKEKKKENKIDMQHGTHEM